MLLLRLFSLQLRGWSDVQADVEQCDLPDGDADVALELPVAPVAQA